MARQKKAFTLIELLIVIAIIGVLASIVLVSLNSARNKSRDAAIRAEVRILTTLFHQQFADTGSYTSLQSGWDDNEASCNNSFGSSAYAAAARAVCVSVINNYTGGAVNVFHTGVNPATFSSNTDFSIMARLNTGNYFCMGSSGRTYEGPGNPGTGSWTGAGCWSNP